MVTAYDIRDHYAHCTPHLARLRMVARYEVGEPLPAAVADEVGHEISVILAEAQTAASVAVAAVTGTRRRAVAGLLSARLARLAAAAREATDAAQQADVAMLGRKLRRFEVLTSAMWTVQQAMSGRPAAVRPVRPAPQRA